MPKTILRQFLYLDAPLVQGFLDQLPGGTRKETRGERQSGSKASLGAGIAQGPVQARAGRDKDAAERTEFEITQSDAADFTTLYAALRKLDAIQDLGALDDDIWEQLEVGEIVEVPASVARPKIMSLIQAAEQAKALLPFMRALGQAEPEGAEILGKMDSLASLFSSTNEPIIVSVAEVPRYRFVASLLPTAMRVEIGAVTGEATVIGKIQRKVRKGQTAMTVDLMRNLQPALPKRKARRSTQQGQQPPEQENFPREYELEIPYPVAVMTPLAIYR